MNWPLQLSKNYDRKFPLSYYISRETFRLEKEKEFEYDDLTEGESFYAFSQHIVNPETFIVLLIHQKSQHF